MPKLIEPRERNIFTANMRLAEVDTTPGFTYLEGRAAPYNEWANRLWFQESFAPGLFDKSIKEASANLPLLMFHDDLMWPIGSASSKDWRSEVDGLHGVWKLDQSPEAQRAAQLAKDGHLAYLSVGYQPIQSTWEWANMDTWDPGDIATLDKVTRVEARLVETSTVPGPAMPSAVITLVRSGEVTRRPRRADARPRLAAWREWRSTLGA